jgi:hypothetical protein
MAREKKVVVPYSSFCSFSEALTGKLAEVSGLVISGLTKIKPTCRLSYSKLAKKKLADKRLVD